MKIHLLLAFSALFGSAMVSAAPDTENNKTITRLGLNDGIENGYLVVAEGVNAKCKYGAVMFTGKQKWGQV
ncbi:MAG: hypothetical protein IV107_13390, partial [Paucibacter sp.]|nr:hypothetical protein [Roseateles sp.]